ncbi:GNAT family N-acetyltransferase [Paenibacillus thermoaerophilus]|uniref:GNAT family N-acetyltransferase n=1 Tax=Paenibacillus thermoaerophilus TaxID=1215385 RepID=A0ABW2V2L7_9BACL|nr:GNAT family N-acetyltransferase [Paenibacillus thermoaerophilus]TMV16035.1 GNAT family N-acetyltransferase [Paenibacillus thermoaerophilus]
MSEPSTNSPESAVIRRIDAARWLRCRPKLLAFCMHHGGGRITKNALEWLAQASPAQVDAPGAAVYAAWTADGRLAGVSAASGYGDDASVVVVRPDCRGQRLGERLLRAIISELGEFRCCVAADNLSSLRSCFRAGMLAYEVFVGPTGKTTFRLKAASDRTPGSRGRSYLAQEKQVKML